MKALPVLERRGVVVPELSFPFPTLTAVASMDGQAAATLGTPIRLEGHDLGGGVSRKVLLVNERLVLEATRPETGTGTDRRLDFELPISNAAEFPAGLYRVGVQLETGTGAVATNQLAFVLAPKLTSLPGPCSDLRPAP